MTLGDRPNGTGTRRALVPQKQSRAVAAPSNVQIQLERLSGAIPAPLKAASRHSIRFGGGAAAIFFILVLAGIAALYARLLAGPVSLSFLVPTLQRQINSQVQGYSFHVGDAILRLSAGWGLEFRLADVRLAGENNQEIATAPFAAIGISEPSLLKLSVAASKISLLGPKVLIFNVPGKGLTFTDPGAYAPALPSAAESGPPPGETSYADLAAKEEMRQAAGVRQLAQASLSAQTEALPFNPAPLLSRLFSAVEKRGEASSALRRVGIQDAIVYFANGKGVSTWRVADFHIDLDEEGNESALKGELALQHEDVAWHATFRALNQLQSKRYSVTASIQDIVPRTIWRSFPALDPLKLVDLAVSGEARFDFSHEGTLLGGEGEIKLGSGQFFVPFDPHPAAIDSGVLRVSYDKDNQALSIQPFELRWDESLLTMSGAITHSLEPGTNHPIWSVDLNGKGTALSAPQFGVQPVVLDAFRISANYQAATDTVSLKEFTIRGSGGGIAMMGQASAISSGGPINATGTVSPMPISFLKLIWPAFVANGGRDWLVSSIPTGRITGGSFSVNLSAATLAALDKDGDIPDSAVSMRLGFSGMQIYHIKGLPPIVTKESVARVTGRHYVFDILGDARIEVPSGRSISFTNGQFAIDDMRPHFPNAEIRFKGTGEVASVLELLDQPPLGYVKAVGFKPNLVNGQVSSAFKIGFPLLKDLKFKQMSLSGKTRVFDLKSNALPGGLTVNGGTITFDASESAVAANGDVKVNNVPVSLVWQRIFDAPPERQPTLRLASVLTEKARDELGLNINHIVRGDLPLALAVAMQRDGPPKLFMEANLTNTDVFLTAIGWRKPPGQKAAVSFDLSQRPDNSLALDNFIMTGDGLNVAGHLVFNDKRRIAAFAFPEFSTNALTKLAIAGELTPQNVLKVQAKGPSYDGRQFFRSLLTAGKIADNQPAPLKDEPGLDLNVEIETVFGYYDSTVKSVVIDAKRRGGKLSYLEVAGRLNGQSPIAVHIEQKPGQPRMLVSDATDAGAALRLTGFYAAVQRGTMNLRVNLDGGGAAEKTGVLDIRRFEVVGDQIVGKVVSQAERERARLKPGAPAQQASGERLIFDHMVVPFSVSSNQFFLQDAAINGPLLGATMRGRIDFGHDTVALTGTYVPFYGVNALFQPLPVISDILNGRNNEGIFGITFAVQGKTSNPDIVVNPVSALAPGFLRQIFEFENQPARAAQP
ncbi:MAG: AsmA-like C-terminal region-containing protein [Rhodomicrobium sp.]